MGVGDVEPEVDFSRLRRLQGVLRMPLRGGLVPRALVVASRLPCPGLWLGRPVGPEDCETAVERMVGCGDG